ncbi:MAG TPA: hypothetical protein VHL34_19490, partial [Rhizomicrobium sp.]|nr:hypothetical protein [Rhizomicrobium sp.]
MKMRALTVSALALAVALAACSSGPPQRGGLGGGPLPRHRPQFHPANEIMLRYDRNHDNQVT